jgi:hypothetical protein
VTTGVRDYRRAHQVDLSFGQSTPLKAQVALLAPHFLRTVAMVVTFRSRNSGACIAALPNQMAGSSGNESSSGWNRSSGANLRCQC